jgi:thioredoxin reductase (NADPH)
MVRSVPCLRPSIRAPRSDASRHCDAKLDIDAERDLAAVAGVQSVPTIMAFRDGVLLLRESGAMPPAVLEDLIRQLEAVDMTKVHAQIAAAEAAAEA